MSPPQANENMIPVGTTQFILLKRAHSIKVLASRTTSLQNTAKLVQGKAIQRNRHTRTASTILLPVHQTDSYSSQNYNRLRKEKENSRWSEIDDKLLAEICWSDDDHNNIQKKKKPGANSNRREMATPIENNARLQRNREEGNCQQCLQTGHVVEWCPKNQCNQCQGMGHIAGNCRLSKMIRTVALQLPFDRKAVIGSGTKCFRNFGLERQLPYLEDSRPARFGNLVIYPQGNRLCIDYDQQQSVVIAMQAENDDAETLIRILPNRVKVSSKYTIHNDQLMEDINKPSTGGVQQTSPDADIHVLLQVESFDDIYMRLEVNGALYLMFWRTEQHGRHIRKPVCVFSTYGYQSMRAYEHRSAIPKWNEYFFGPAIKSEPVAEVEAEETASDDDDNESCVSTTYHFAREIVHNIIEVASERDMAPDAGVLNKYGFQRYFMPREVETKPESDTNAPQDANGNEAGQERQGGEAAAEQSLAEQQLMCIGRESTT